MLKLLLDGKVQEGTQALSDYVQDMKEKRGRAGRAGDKGKKKAAARKRWAARGMGAVPKDAHPHDATTFFEEPKPSKFKEWLPPGVKLGSDLEARDKIRENLRDGA